MNKKQISLKQIFRNILVLLNLIVLLCPYSSVFASEESTVIGNTATIYRGDQSDYVLEYWNEDRGQWMYIISSPIYYTSKQGPDNREVAYCVNPEYDGVGYLPGEAESYEVDVSDRKVSDSIWRVLKNGYPYKPWGSLGVKTEDDAYLATKQAIYSIIRGRTVEDCRNYYRAGQTEINGQDMQDTTLRGTLVLNCICRLVDIGLNGTETYAETTLQKVGEFRQDEINPDYYVQEYVITNQAQNKGQVFVENISFEDSTDDLINKVKIYNGSGTETRFTTDKLYIKIPSSEIKHANTMHIKYQLAMKDFPVVFSKSRIAETQDYVLTIREDFDVKEGNTDLEIPAPDGKIYINKIDEETGKNVEGAIIAIEYHKPDGTTETITKVSLAEGEILVDNLAPGSYTVFEAQAPNQYNLNQTKYDFELGYNEEKNIEISNKHKKGNLEIEKVDKDNNSIKLPNVKFELLDANKEVVYELVTNEEGKASIQNINTGKYTLKEVETLEDYELMEDKEININENETAVIVLENKKQRGNLEIEKVDKDDNSIKLKDVEIELLDENHKSIDIYKTDIDGKIRIDNLKAGKYYIKELKTNTEYVLKDELIEVHVKGKQDNNLVIENEKIKGYVRIIKEAADDNEITKDKAGDRLEGVTFEIYDEQGKTIETLITNENGEVFSSKLTYGKYGIREVGVTRGFLLTKLDYYVEINENEKVYEINVKNNSKKPLIDITKEGPDEARENEEIKYKFEIKNLGNCDLNEFVWYDFLPYNQGEIEKISTGTYNQELEYKIYYRTNLKNEYVLFKDKLSTKENYIFDLVTEISLEENEVIQEIKFDFGDVKVGFENKLKPEILFKVNSNLCKDEKIKNETILEAKCDGYKLVDEDEKITTILKDEEPKKLPRTGF